MHKLNGSPEVEPRLEKFICLLQEWGRALLKGRDGSTQTNEEVKGTLVQHKSSVIIQVTIVHLSHI